MWKTTAEFTYAENVEENSYRFYIYELLLGMFLEEKDGREHQG
jgi:hypothetical protein